MSFKNNLFSCAALASFLFAPCAYAEGFAPSFHGLVLFEAQNDWAFDSDDPDADVNTLTATIEPYFILSLTDRLALETLLVLEQVQDPDPNDDTFIDNHGAYISDLLVSYTGNNYSLKGGKFGPTFGTAWDLTPGIYGADFAEDYELSELITLAGSYTFGGESAGYHTITANTFFADTTFMSESAITQRGKLDKSDGGLANTENFSSYSVTLDSENIFGAEGLNTHLGYRDLSEGDADVGLSNETGFAIGANYTFPVSDDVEATVLGEWVGIYDSGGGTDNVDYLTTGLGLTIHENWNVAASYTSRDTNVSGGADIDDYVYQLSAGYAFENGFTLDLGYSNREESGVDTDIVGALISYVYEF